MVSTGPAFEDWVSSAIELAEEIGLSELAKSLRDNPNDICVVRCELKEKARAHGRKMKKPRRGQFREGETQDFFDLLQEYRKAEEEAESELTDITNL